VIERHVSGFLAGHRRGWSGRSGRLCDSPGTCAASENGRSGAHPKQLKYAASGNRILKGGIHGIHIMFLSFE
jgi:hypothetical protein